MISKPLSMADSLTQDEIPIKLRCASCNKLVVNAFRLPCCDQSVCESCQASLPDSCPVCAHSPLSPDDCKPNKALRLTVKAFLKNEEKKRDRLRDSSNLKASTTPMPQADASQKPVEQVHSSSVVSAPQDSLSEIIIESTSVMPAPTQTSQTEAKNFTQDDNQNTTSNSLPEASDNADATMHTDKRRSVSATVHESVEQPPPSDVITPSQNDTSVNVTEDENTKSQQMDTKNTAGAFPMSSNQTNNNWSMPNFNPMLAMSNNIQAGGWQNFPNMMGVAGMGMDPMMMMSQGMFGGFGGQGMGMNGMSGMNGMNMGMGFDGGYGNWYGQQATNMGGMNGDFGANAGYYPGSGYNHQAHAGHFNQMHNQQFSNDNYHQNRFQGPRSFQSGQNRHSGQTYSGNMQSFTGDSGAAHYSSATDQSQQEAKQSVESAQGNDVEGSEAVQHDPSKSLPTDPEKQLDATIDVADTTNSSNLEAIQQAQDGEVTISSTDQTHADDEANGALQNTGDVEGEPNGVFTAAQDGAETTIAEQPLQAIETFESSFEQQFRSEADARAFPANIVIPRGPAAQYAAAPQNGPGYGKGAADGFAFRGAFRGRGVSRGGGRVVSGIIESPQDPVVGRGQGVAGAPTGPKAMRTPNSAFRGRGGLQAGSKMAPPSSVRTNDAHSLPASETQPTTPDIKSNAEQQDHENTPTPADTSDHDETLRQSRKEVQTPNQDDFQDDERGKENGTKSSSSRRRSRDRRTERSSPKREQDRDRDRDRSREHRRRRRRSGSRSKSESGKERETRHDEASKESNSSNRHAQTQDARRNGETSSSRYQEKGRPSQKPTSRRDRSPSSERERERGKDGSSRDRTRDRDRDRDRDRRRRRRHRSPHSLHRAPEAPPESREFKIKDRSKRVDASSISNPKSNAQPRNTIPHAPKADIDAHTLEREARNRERMLKEQQRRDLLINPSVNDRKRGRNSSNGIQDFDENEHREHKSSRRKLEHGGGAGGGGAGEHTGQQDLERARRKAFRYEDEERALRVEKEREAERWR